MEPTDRQARGRGHRLGLGLALILLGSVSCAPEVGPPTPTIQIVPPPGSGVDLRLATFDVVRLDRAVLRNLARSGPGPEGWEPFFSVSIADGMPVRPRRQPAIPGHHAVVDAVVRFTPREPLVPGTRYRVDFDPAHLPPVAGTRPVGGPITAYFHLTPDAESASRVTPIESPTR